MPDYNMLVKVTSQGMDQVSKGLEALGRNIDKAITQADKLSKSIESINGSISNVDFSPMSAPAIPATTQNTVALENAVNRLASEVNKNTEAFGAFSSLFYIKKCFVNNNIYFNSYIICNFCLIYGIIKLYENNLLH